MPSLQILRQVERISGCRGAVAVGRALVAPVVKCAGVGVVAGRGDANALRGGIVEPFGVGVGTQCRVWAERR